MALSTEQQIAKQLEQHSRILVCLPENPSTDAVASGLAMYTILQKMGKQARIVASGFTLPSTHRFLPQSNAIENDLNTQRKFVISLNLGKRNLKELNYDIQGEQLNIFVQPDNGFFNASDVGVSSQEYQFDAIVVLDCRDLPSLGAVFTNNAEFFHHSPIINIDHHPGNENFGQVNLLNVTATSISEMVYELLDHVEGEYMDEHIATNLLTGIISKTKSFKTNTVTPRSLAVASLLIDSGARRDDIVKNLYQTKSIESLQLWGRALSKLESDSDRKIVWSSLTREDFATTNTSAEDLEAVIDELIVNTPDAENVYVVYEQTDSAGHVTVGALIHTQPYIQGLTAFRDWAATGTDDFTYVTVPHSSLQMAQQLIHDHLREIIK